MINHQLPLTIPLVEISDQQMLSTFERSNLKERFTFDEVLASGIWKTVLRIETKNKMWRNSHEK